MGLIEQGNLLPLLQSRFQHLWARIGAFGCGLNAPICIRVLGQIPPILS